MKRTIENSRSSMTGISWLNSGSAALAPEYEPEVLKTQPSAGDSEKDRMKERIFQVVGIRGDSCCTDEDAGDEPEGFGKKWKIYRMVGLKEVDDTDSPDGDPAAFGAPDFSDEYDFDDDMGEGGFFSRCREFSLAGLLMSGMAGLLIQICVFVALGLEVSMTPAVTLVFLWILFSMISAGIAAELENMLYCFRSRKKRRD